MTVPVPDRAAAAALGKALRKVGYVEDALDDLLDEDAYSGKPEDVLVAARRLPQSPLGTAIRLLFLQMPVAAREATDAFGRKAVEALATTGLAELGAQIVPTSRIVPISDVLLAADGFTRDADDPPDYVASYTPTARTCDVLTVRKRGRRALDVGTGSGIHALLAARRHREVVAVDVNPRALAYTALNAALNGFDNVECRAGSFFEPVEGETFDLITCNAPYVVSPEQRWAYRDGGLRGDDLTKQLTGAAASHLAKGGYATLLGSWLVTRGDDPEERPVAWVEKTGCDGWVLASPVSEPLEHAASWNAQTFGDTTEFADALDEWTAYLAELGARGVVEGAILLHRRGDGSATMRVDEMDEDMLEPAGDQIRRAFANRARLADMRVSDLPSLRLTRAMPLRVERDIGRRGGEITVDAGTNSVLPATGTGVRVVEGLNGKATLKRLGADRAALSLCRDLLELGALRFA